MIPNSHPEYILRDIATRDDADIDLAEGALALAALQRPCAETGWYKAHIQRLSDEVSNALAGGKDLKGAINQVVFCSHGYTGDTLTYDDIQNANLMRVIDRKKGLPVALGILLLQTARSCGYSADGLNFPGHFLIRIGQGRERKIVDPFNGGVERTALDLRDLLKVTIGLDAELVPEHYEAAKNRDILIRLQTNIKIRHERAGRFDEAIRVVDSMLLFAPGSPFLWRELGVLQSRTGNYGAAIEAFRALFERAPSEAMQQEAASAIQELKRFLN